MRPRRHVPLLLAGVLALAVPARPAEPLKPGDRIDTLTVGKSTYTQVQVRALNARTLVILHAGGMASIRLRDLPPEWQARCNYDPAAEAAQEAAANTPRPAPTLRRPAPAGKSELSRFDALLRQFGEPASVQASIDLRPRYFELELGVKNQGRRPSCSVFAVIGALEFQNAETTGRVERYSEEYLIWATRRSVQRLGTPGPMTTPDDPDAAGFQDEGFSLSEVVAAIRAYGLPLQARMPNTFGTAAHTIAEPPPEVVQEARSHQRVFVHPVPGRDRTTLINNVVHALNAGLPVPVGMAWPRTRVVNGYISTHQAAPNSGHAVTLVGYKSPTGRIADAYFIFKNSWGPTWGQGGYGTVTYSYLHENLYEAVLLEAQPPAARPGS